MEQGWNSNLVFSSGGQGFWHDGVGVIGRQKARDPENGLVISKAIAFGRSANHHDASRQTYITGTLHNDFIGRDASDAADGKIISFAWQQGVSENDRSYPVRQGEYSGSISSTRVDAVAGGFGVRRLTPTECERLQGFPDRWTACGIDDKGNRVEISDSARYRMLGNAVCFKVTEWLGKRIAKVENGVNKWTP